MTVAGWPATGEGLGAGSGLGIRRGQRLVPLHGISPLWVLYDLQAGPRGIFRRCDALRGIDFECALSKIFFCAVCFQ